MRVTANYVGEVAKTDCQIVTYTATFGSMEAPGESSAPTVNDPSDPVNPDDSVLPFNWAEVKAPVMMVGMVLILVIGGVFAFQKIRRRYFDVPDSL